MSDDTKFMFIGGAVSGAFLILVIGCALALSRYNCSQVSEMSGKETRFKVIGGCYVKVNGQFIPKDNWRGEYER